MPRPTDRSHDNSATTSPTIRRIRRLRTRYHRETSGFFFVEGVRFVIHALDHGANIERLVVCKKLLRNPLAQKLVRIQKREGVPVDRVTTDEFLSFSTSAEPQGIGAFVRQSWTALEQIDSDAGLCRVALHSVRSPGNLGTIIRTCDAVGATGLILVGGQVDPFDQATVRASMASLFNLELTRTSDAEFRDWVHRSGAHVVGTSPAASTRYDKIQFRHPTIIFMGDERKGLGLQEQALCEDMVRIPMIGSADSLNLGVATSLLLYEVFRQHNTTDAL